MADAWNGAWGTAWGDAWGASSSPGDHDPVSGTFTQRSPNGVMGIPYNFVAKVEAEPEAEEVIGGHFAWPKKKIQEETKKVLIEQIQEESKEFEDAPVEVKKQVRKITKPYIKRNVVNLDVNRIREDIVRLNYLLQAWQQAKRIEKELKEDEEDILMLIMQDII